MVCTCSLLSGLTVPVLKDRRRVYRLSPAPAAPHDAQHVVALHCMPAHLGQEISAAVLDGPRSLGLEQAENRRYVHESVLIELLSAR